MKKILIVEDDDNIRDNTSELLEMEQYTVLQATNGQEGFEIVLNELPDLILCDLAMPLMDGFQLLANLKKAIPAFSVSFIFFTAYSEKSQIQKGLAMGANAYLVKPFSAEELIATVRKNLSQLEPDQ